MPTLEALEQKYFVSDPNGPNRAYRGPASDVEALIDGEEYFAAVYEAIQRTSGPGHAIYILGWMLESSEFRFIRTAPPLQDLLVEKAEQGVDVRAIFWSITSFRPFQRWDIIKWFLKTGELQVTATQVVRIRQHNPRGRPQPPLADRILLDWSAPDAGAHHQKAIVVIGSADSDPASTEMVAFVGGMELTSAVRDPVGHDFPAQEGVTARPWHDAAIAVYGRAAEAVHANFHARWAVAESLPRNESTWQWLDGESRPDQFARIPEALPPMPPAPPSQPDRTNPRAQETSVQVVQTFGHSDAWWLTPAMRARRADVWSTLVKAVSAAERYIYIEDQYLGSPEGFEWVEREEVTKLLTTTLRNRPSVKLIFLTSGATSWSDIAEPLRDAEFASQLAVWRVDGEKRDLQDNTLIDPIFVHAKVVLVDDAFAMVGSANFADRSLTTNSIDGTDSELSVGVVSNGTWVRDLRVRLWSEHLTPITIDSVWQAELETIDLALGLWRTPWLNPAGRTLPTPDELVRRLPPGDQYYEVGTPRVLLRYVGPGDAP